MADVPILERDWQRTLVELLTRLGYAVSDPERLARRFHAKVERGDGCWEWTASHDLHGYGRFRVGGRGSPEIKAHRVAVLLDGRTIPVGCEVDHLCRNRGCVRPDHLEVVTGAVNRQRQTQAVSPVCLRGHAKRDHQYVSPNGRNRHCLACRRDKRKTGAWT